MWSYILDYENTANPFPERQQAIHAWRKHAARHVGPDEAIEDSAEQLQSAGIKPKDALHIACAIHAGCDSFITTDKSLLNKLKDSAEVQVINPIDCLDNLESTP